MRPLTNCSVFVLMLAPVLIANLCLTFGLEILLSDTVWGVTTNNLPAGNLRHFSYFCCGPGEKDLVQVNKLASLEARLV